MVRIFKTDVTSDEEAKLIIHILLKEYVDVKINFDLQDCDNILRVEGVGFSDTDIINSLDQLGYHCVPLE